MAFSTDQKLKLEEKSYECTSDMTSIVRASLGFFNYDIHY